jgi:CBS-domain-containing membrane protein
MVQWNNRHEWHRLLQGMIGSFLGIWALALVTDISQLIASFGASAVLLYAAPESPLAQPKNVLGGQLISALIGVAVVQSIGISWFSIALAVSMSIGMMNITKTLHPPGGATAIIAVWTAQKFQFVFLPVLVGTLLLLVIAQFNNFLFSQKIFELVKKHLTGGKSE